VTPARSLRLRTAVLGAFAAALALAACTAPVGDAPDRPVRDPGSGTGTAADEQLCDPRPGAPAVGVFRGSGDPARIDEFEQWLGCHVEYVVEFPARDTWETIANPQYLVEQWQDESRGLILSVPMLPNDGDGSMEAGASGEYNSYYVLLAETLVEGGRQDALIRLGWEFNLPGSNWRADDPGVFRDYWRQVVDAMRSVSGQDFGFIWNPGRSGDDAVPYYPGDDVVDYVGVDVYDATGAAGTYPYPRSCDESCRLERQITAWDEEIYGGETGLAYYSQFARSRGKPLMLPEWGLWDRDDDNSGGENLYFLRQMHNFIYEPANNVVLQAYFEWDAPQGDHRLMDTFLEAGELFRDLFVYPPVVETLQPGAPIDPSTDPSDDDPAATSDVAEESEPTP
jgi:hypothetical protein